MSRLTARPTMRTLLPWGLVTLLGLIAGWQAVRCALLQTEADVLQQQHALVGTALNSLQQQLEAERILNSRQIASLADAPTVDPGRLQLAMLRPANGHDEPMAVVAWDPTRQSGVVVFERTPSIPAGEKLELWLLVAGENMPPISAGLLGLPADRESGARLSFKLSAPVPAATAFAISREKAGGNSVHRHPAEVVLRGPTL